MRPASLAQKHAASGKAALGFSSGGGLEGRGLGPKAPAPPGGWKRAERGQKGSGGASLAGVPSRCGRVCQGGWPGGSQLCPQAHAMPSRGNYHCGHFMKGSELSSRNTAFSGSMTANGMARPPRGCWGGHRGPAKSTPSHPPVLRWLPESLRVVHLELLQSEEGGSDEEK